MKILIKVVNCAIVRLIGPDVEPLTFPRTRLVGILASAIVPVEVIGDGVVVMPFPPAIDETPPLVD